MNRWVLIISFEQVSHYHRLVVNRWVVIISDEHWTGEFLSWIRNGQVRNGSLPMLQTRLIYCILLITDKLLTTQLFKNVHLCSVSKHLVWSDLHPDSMSYLLDLIWNEKKNSIHTRDVTEPANIRIRRMRISCAKSVGCGCGFVARSKLPAIIATVIELVT